MNLRTYHKRYAVNVAKPVELCTNTIRGKEIQTTANMRNSKFVMIACYIEDSSLFYATLFNN